MDEESNQNMVQTINAMVREIEKLQLKIAQLEHSHKILKTETFKIKTMSDNITPTIGDLMGRNGRKGA